MLECLPYRQNGRRMVGVAGWHGGRMADIQPFVIVAIQLPVWQPGILLQDLPTDGNKMI